MQKTIAADVGKKVKRQQDLSRIIFRFNLTFLFLDKKKFCNIQLKKKKRKQLFFLKMTVGKNQIDVSWLNL